MIKKILPILLITLLWGCGSKNKSQKAETESNTSINSILLTDLKGNRIDLSAYQDKIIFINFWATWCAPCVREMPSLQKMQESFNQQNIVFFFASDEPLNRIKNFQEKKQFDLNFVHLETSLENLNIMALPTTIIIDGEGNELFRETGSRDWSSEKTIKKIKSLIP